MTVAVRLRGLDKRFPRVHALRGVDLDIEQGEFFALLGPNGAGKTTLISILAGLTRATAGSVSILGFDVTRQYRDARRSLGVVPQELVYDPFFTVRETLRLQSGYFGLRRNDDWIDELLSNLGLSDKADAYTRQLSGGMKRRVLVAQALVNPPPAWTWNCGNPSGPSSAASTGMATPSSSPPITWMKPKPCASAWPCSRKAASSPWTAPRICCAPGPNAVSCWNWIRPNCLPSFIRA
jgi:predicted ABC-type transport system involved in lysophospholipase L1 biosynthesis ATPase subunit